MHEIIVLATPVINFRKDHIENPQIVIPKRRDNDLYREESPTGAKKLER